MRIYIGVQVSLILIGLLFATPYVFLRASESGDIGEACLLILLIMSMSLNLLFCIKGEKILGGKLI